MNLPSTAWTCVVFCLPQCPSTGSGGTLQKASLPSRMLGRQAGCQQWSDSGFLLHCATGTLMTQIQILPHIGTAELQAYSLGRWVRKPDSSRMGGRGRSCSRKPYKEFKLRFKLKDPFYFSKWSWTIRERGKFDSGPRRSSASANRSHVNWSLCFKLSLLLLSHKLHWSTHPVFYLQPRPAADIVSCLI